MVTGGADHHLHVCNVTSAVRRRAQLSPVSPRDSAAGASISRAQSTFGGGALTVDANGAPTTPAPYEGNAHESFVQQRVSGHADRVYGIDVHPRAPIIASASADGTVKLWTSAAK